jgi:hypothetical protein
MKMNTGVIIGIIIILLGLSILFKGFPFFRIVFGGLLIFWGVSIIFGGFGHRVCWWNRDTNTTFFRESTHSYSANTKEHNLVFGRGVYDFTSARPTDGNKNIELHTVFGASEVLINKDVPCRIFANSAFGEAEMPNGNSTAFGSITYQNEVYRSDSACINLRIDVVFGSVKVKEI